MTQHSTFNYRFFIRKSSKKSQPKKESKKDSKKEYMVRLRVTVDGDYADISLNEKVREEM